MKNLIQKMKSLKNFPRSRGQVFILATLIIVVYTVSIVAVVTEVSINRTKTDSVNLTHTVNEYVTDMKYQLRVGLYDYVHNGVSADTVIANIQTFISSFTQYASTRGIDASINLRLNEFIISATQNTGVLTPVVLNPNYNGIMFISLNSSILFQSSNSGSKISGVFIHYFGMNAFISGTSPNDLILTEKDFYGNTLHYITGATFTTALAYTDNNNGDYTFSSTLAGEQLNITQASGFQFLS